MKKAAVLIIIAAIVAVVVLKSGGDGTKISAENKKVFSAAINAYLKQKSFGMAVDSFDSLEINDNSAVAVCKMKHADEMYNMKVTWRFTFTKAKGTWQASQHEKK